MLNKKFKSAELYEIDFTPKGTRNRKTLYVWARSQLDASNFLILNGIWGTQHAIRPSTTNLIKD